MHHTPHASNTVESGNNSSLSSSKFCYSELLEKTEVPTCLSLFFLPTSRHVWWPVEQVTHTVGSLGIKAEKGLCRYAGISPHVLVMSVIWHQTRIMEVQAFEGTRGATSVEACYSYPPPSNDWHRISV